MINPELISAEASAAQIPAASDNLPDNSNLQCNLCVTGLDESLTLADLDKMFSKFGPIKSLKLPICPKTNKSMCYGYVWFEQEESCKAAIAESKTFKNNSKMPY